MENHKKNTIRDLLLPAETIETKEVLLSVIEQTLNQGKEIIKAIQQPVILFETDNSYRQIIYNILTLRGYNIQVATSIQEIQKLCIPEEPHLVLINILHIDTHTLIQNLKEQSPSITIVALRPHNDRSPTTFHCDAVITKPFIPSEFIATINNLSKRKQETV